MIVNNTGLTIKSVGDYRPFAYCSALKVDIVEHVSNFVFMVNTNEATYGDSPNLWWYKPVILENVNPE